MPPIKYIIRRILAGIVIVPAVAITYFVGYATLVALGCPPTASAPEVWDNGLVMGVVATLILIFKEPIERLVMGEIK